MSERRSELKAIAAGEENADGSQGQDLAAMTAHVWDGLAQVNTHLMSLAQSSWRHTQTAADELRQAQTPQEIVDVQLKVARQATDDYLDEARKIGELVAKLSTDAASYLRFPR